MVIKTAKRGNNAGNKFYGCPNYPKCRETIPFDSEVNTNKVDTNNNYSNYDIKYDFPKKFIARELYNNYQVFFIENTAIPSNLLEKIYLTDNEKLLNNILKWRVDFPNYNETGEETRIGFVISVLEKILTRGKKTFLSPDLENDLSDLFNPDPSIEISDLYKLLNIFNKKDWNNIFFDSKEEEIFFNTILPGIFEENIFNFIIPQTNLPSLLEKNNQIDDFYNQRVDFVFFHPSNNTKIIIEIDGPQHYKNIDQDNRRDGALIKKGFRVIRIKTEDINNNNIENIQKQLDPLLNIDFPKIESYTNNVKFLYAVRISLQIQIVLLMALQKNFLNIENISNASICTDINLLNIFDEKESKAIINLAINDFLQLLNNILQIYDINITKKSPDIFLHGDKKNNTIKENINISFVNKFSTNENTFFIHDVFLPFSLPNYITPVKELDFKLKIPAEKDLQYFLKYIFRKNSFWEGQYESITRGINGLDTVLLLPTGGGKSLTFQLATFLLPGKSIVIEPIISLMEDQVENLKLLGIDRSIAITGQITNPDDRKKIIELFSQGEYIFAYVSPERFQTEEFRKSLRMLTLHSPISIIVVDEAHCVSEWGHDFRTAYLNIGRIGRKFCKKNDYVPPIFALTGTASRAVLKDVQRELEIEDFESLITPTSFDRKELNYYILNASSSEKEDNLKIYMNRLLPNQLNISASSLYSTKDKGTNSGIIFCPHVNGDFGVVEVSEKVSNGLNIASSFYSGKMPKFWNNLSKFNAYKRKIARDFKSNRIPILVSTNAFGMGIDKSNIRYTIHYGLPPSIESFYQEAGRAGRDRNRSICCIIVSNDDTSRTEKLLDANTKIEEISSIINNIKSRDENDDITRALYFHVNAFRGINKEIEDIKKVVVEIGDIGTSGKTVLTYSNKDSRNDIEKSIHRLLLIGVVNDYTINYKGKEINIELSGAGKEEIIEKYGNYVFGFLGPKRREVELDKAKEYIDLGYNDFIINILKLLLNFIYNNIEKGRRRALQEIYLCSKQKNFREYMLNYLGRGKNYSIEITEMLEKVLNASDAGINEIQEVIEEIQSPREAAELRGSISRSLESYPDQPALLLGRAFSEIYTSNYNADIIEQNLFASISSATDNYGFNVSVIIDIFCWGINKIFSRDRKLSEALLKKYITLYPDRIISADLVKKLPLALCYLPALNLIKRLNLSINKILTGE